MLLWFERLFPIQESVYDSQLAKCGASAPRLLRLAMDRHDYPEQYPPNFCLEIANPGYQK
jgi:hypothetical protein